MPDYGPFVPAVRTAGLGRTCSGHRMLALGVDHFLIFAHPPAGPFVDRPVWPVGRFSTVCGISHPYYDFARGRLSTPSVRAKFRERRGPVMSVIFSLWREKPGSLPGPGFRLFRGRLCCAAAWLLAFILPILFEGCVQSGRYSRADILACF